MAKATNTVTVLPLPKFQTPWRRVPTRYTENHLPSLTSPDKTLTIPQIMERFASGRSDLGGFNNTGIFHGEGHDTKIDDDVLLGRNWDSFDLSEKHEIIKDLSTDFQKLQKGINDKKEMDKKAAAAKAKSFQDRMEKLEKQLKDHPGSSPGSTKI